MPDKIRIYNSSYNEIFPIPEGKEQELIEKAKKYKMGYEIIKSKPTQQNNTQQAVPVKPIAQQSNSENKNNSNQIDLSEIDSDTLISNYNEGVEQAKQMRGQNKEELKRNIYNSKREKDNQDREKQSPMDELKSNQVTGNIKLATSPTYDAFGRDIATEEQLKAREQLNKNQGAILSNSFLRPDKDGKIPSNTANTEIEKGDTKKRVEMPQMDVDAEGNIQPYGWGEDNTDINKKIIQGRAYDKQVAQDRKQEQIENIEYNTQLAELSNDKEKESLRYKILPDINNLASTELQGLDALTNQGKLSPFARNYLSNQISRKAKKMQENGLNAFDAINRDNIEGITTLGWISVVRNGVNAHFLNSLGEASPEDKDSYMQAMDLISSADNSTTTSNVGYDVLNGVMQSLPYMGEFALTGGVIALGKEATKSVTKNVAKGLIKSGIKKKAAIKIGQYLGANAPKLMAFSVASPFAYQHAQEKAIERVGKDFKLEDIKVSDILEGYAKNAIEFAVEGSGGLMKLGIDKVAGNGRIGSFFSYLKNKTPEQIREIYKAAKFNGVGYEFAEEFLQNIVDTMVWDEMTWEEVFDPYNNFITLATCAMIQSPATVIQSGSYIKDKYKIHQDLGVVAADDRLVAKELKRAMSVSDQSKRYKAVLNSGIANLKSAKAQKSALDYVFRTEKMMFQKQVIDEERINTARREVIPIVAGLSYNNSIATVESNEGDKYFIVGETNQDTRLVPVRKIVTEKDANGNEFSRIEGVKRLVDFDKLDASTYLSTPYEEYVNRLVDSKLGNTRLQEQQQEIKAEELGMAVEQQTEAATIQDFQSIQEVQTQSEELGVEDKEIRAGSVVTIIGDSNESNKRNFSVINTDGINAVVEDNESGIQHTLPLSVLNVEYQLIDKNEKEIKAVENAINGVETAPVEETLQVNTELQTLPTQEETIQEQQQDIYADFPRDKNGEIDVDKLSIEQQLIYAENEVGKDFAVNQATQVKNNLLKQIDSLNKKMPSMSLAKAVQVKKDIAKLEEEVGIYDIYINENSESIQQEEENLNLENKTYSERLSFLEEFAQNDPRAYVLYGIAAGRIKFIWGGERGIARELGLTTLNKKGERVNSAGEMRARFSILSNRGYTPDALAEELAEEFPTIDALQGRDVVIETLSEINSKKDALLTLESSYIKFNPEKDINYIAQLEQEEKAAQEAVAYENDIIDAYWRYELQNLDEKNKQISIFAETIGVPSDLIQGSQSTYDLITLIEEYNGQNNNTTGDNGSNGVSQSEGTQDSGIEQGVREGESDRARESEDSNSYQSSKENGLSNIQDEPTRNEVSDDTDKRGNNSEGYGKEQSDNANQTLGEQKPQEIRDVSGSSNEESYNVKEESNLPNGNDAIRSEEVYKEGISNTETGESATSTNEVASQGDSQVGKSSLENQVQSIINKFIEDNNFRFKAVRVISKNSDEYRKKAGNKNVTGWYLPTTNEVVIVYDNLGKDVENEVKKTYLHEILGHKTIREALRKEDYIPLMQLIYDAIPAFYKAEIRKNQGKEIRNTVELELSDKGITNKATIEQEYQKRLDEIVANRIEREQAQYKDKIEYADEFLAVFTENYDNLTPESKKTLIDIIKDFFKRVFGIDADNNFFEDLVKLSYEIARGEKTAQGKINKLNSMLNAPAVAELSKEELKVDTNPAEGQKPFSNYKEVIEKHTPKYLFDNYSEAYKKTGYNLVSRFYSEELHTNEGGLRKKYLGDKYFNKETRKLKPLYVAYNSNNEELIGAYLTPEEAYNAAINRDIEGFEVLYFDKTNEIYDLNSFHIYDGEVDWSDENGTLKPDISQRVINKISLLGKEETAEQQKIAELKEKKAKLYAELKAKMNQLNAGLDPELIIKAVEIININAQLGMIKFNQVAKEMIDILGDKIKPFVKDIYNMARTSNDEYAEEFDTREYVEKFDLEKGFDEEIKEEQIIKPKENTKNTLRKPKNNVSLQNTLFDEEILETLKTNEDEQQHSDNAQRLLQGNSSRLSKRESQRDDGRRDSRNSGIQSEDFRGANDGIGQSNDGQGSVLSADVRVLNSEPKPALVEVQIEANDTKSFNKNQKYKDNISALKVLLTLIEEKRKATPKEKEILLKYVGFGGLKEVLLDPNKLSGWKESDLKYKDSIEEVIKLANKFDVLTGNKDTIGSIKSSTLNAHFTSETLINAIYKGIAQLGFNGGTIVEPSSGIGNFLTYIPNKIKRASNITAIEIEPLTGNILKYIHDDSKVIISGYENAKIKDNSADLVISNIPFGNYKVFDPKFKGEKTSFMKRIHTYFFAKAVDTVREGGIIAFVTSTGVMDSNANEELRKYLVDSNVNFLGALRLPNTAFKNVANTSVVTDVIFLQKSNVKTEDNKKRNEEFVNSSSIEVKHKDGAIENVNVNNFFVNNPDFVLGNFVAGGLYSRNDYSVEDNGSYKDINNLILQLLPKNVYTSTESGIGLQANDKIEDIEGLKEGSITYQDGKLYKKEDGEIVEININEPTKKIESYIELRNTLIDLIYSEYIGKSDIELKEKRDVLNKQYDEFIKKYGYLEKSIIKIAKYDADAYSVAALENKDKSKADIFFKQTINPIKKNQRAETIEQAIVVSLYENAKIDIERIAELLDKSVEEAIELGKGKIFEEPTGGFVTRDEYLSGNVKKKYKLAKKAVEEGYREFEYNVSELEAVLPKDIPAVQIEARLGSRWIPAKVYTQFARELFQDDYIKINYIVTTDEYLYEGKAPISALTTNKYGTARVNALKILVGALQINPPKVYDKQSDGSRILNEKETGKAKEKYEELRELFEDWVYKDSERRDLLARIYNDKHNTNVRRKYDGSNLYIAGINGIELRQHQKDAIWMLLQNNGGVIDHLVGAGKTYVMVAATMEMRRTNVAKKPMILALKSTIPQIVESYRSAFPMAKILAPTEKDFKKENRLKLFAKIANNEYDCIIMSHENYGKIPHEREIEERLLKEELDALIQEFVNLRTEGSEGSKKALQGLEVRIENQQAKIEELLSRAKDNTITFEQMGIDHIMVDESQQYKNLSYTTKMYGVAGLGVATGSKRAFNLLVGIRHLQDIHNGDKGVTFLSGTPITNSMVEMYSLLKYLRPTKLKELEMNTFDSWATTFANPSTDIEFTVTGEFKQKTRIREFINVPELSMMYTEIADIRTDDNLSLDKPKMKGGGYTVVPITMSEEQKDYAERLILAAKRKDGSPIGRFLSKKEEKAIMLIVTNLSSKMAIDMRLVDSSYSYDKNGKIAKLVENVAKTYRETDEYKGTQLIFSDIGTPKTTTNKVALLRDYMSDELNVNIDTLNFIFGDNSVENYKYPLMNAVIPKMRSELELSQAEIDDILEKSAESAGQFNVYQEVKDRLIEEGIPENQIVFIHDYPSQKSKAKLFEEVNAGNIRIVLGSTQKLGTGVNVQKRIVAVHHLDVPWTPASMEQRNGRALRQGNIIAKQYLNNEISVYAYATERTLDTYKYQLLQTKQRFLNQVKSGDIEDRVISEGDSEGDSGVGYAEMVAILSGNKDILMKSKLEEKIKKLQRAKRNFEGEFDDAKSNIDKLLDKVVRVEENLSKTIEALNTLPYILDEENKIVIDNVNGQKVKGEDGKEPKRVDYAKKAIKIVEDNLNKVIPNKVFEIILGGYNLKYWTEYEGVDLMTQQLKKKMSLVAGNGLIFSVNYSTTPGVLLNNIQKKIEVDIPALIESQKTLISKTNKDIETYKEIIINGREWSKAGELIAARQELKEVIDRLKESGELEEKKVNPEEELESYIDVDGVQVKETNYETDDEEFASKTSGQEKINKLNYLLGNTSTANKGRENTNGNTDSTLGNIEKDVNTKTGEDIYVVNINGRVERDRYDELNKKAKNNNGYYSRFKKGFIFKTEEDAKFFVSTDNNDIRFREVPTNKNFVGPHNIPEWKLVKDNLAKDEGIRYRLREKPAPKNTIKAYKLFRTDNKGNLYTLFIDNNVPLKIGSWYDADSPQMDVLSKLPHTEGEKEIYLINKDNTFELWSGNTKLPKISEVNNASISQARYIQVSDGKNGRMYHNVGINGANGVSLYAMRAGLHSTNVPSAHHIGKGRAGAKAVNRPDNQVWAEIEVSADVNYQDEALSNAPIVTSKSSANYGKPNMAMAQITDKIPIDGYYIYQTNTNANKAQDWIISGAMKINKVLDDNTTKKIARDLGFDEDLPRVQEKINRFNELLNGNTDIRYRTINIDGKERPTINSLGKPIASTEEGLRNFWKWFGDSKVVDSEGLPLVVYHGTKVQFSSFDTKKQLIGWLGRGFYFSSNKDEAKGYGKIKEVYLNSQNPFIVQGDKIDSDGNVEFAGGIEGQIKATYEKYDYTDADVSKILKENNHDGVIHGEMISVFSPNQIKSIDNVGTFDPENADIRFREIEDYWREFASENYDSEELRFRTKDKSKAKIERFNALLNEDYEKEKNKKKTFEDRKNEIEIAYFNKFKPLKDIHEKLIEDGAYIPFNIYQRTVSADSRINAKIEKLDETLGEALKESIAKVQKKGGFFYDEIGIYFQAQFMPERTAQLIQKRIEKDFVLNRINKTIQDLEDKKAKNYSNLKMSEKEIEKENNKINKSISKLTAAKELRKEKIQTKFQEQGLAGEQGLKELMESKGFPDVTPEDYIKMFEKEVGDTELINELNRNKKAIVKFTLDVALRTGQISKEQYAEYTSFENYVPLRGWDMTFDDSGEDNIFQSVSKVAKGRKSLAANPINYLYAMAYTAVTFGEKNILKNNLATLALMNRSNSAFMDNFGYNSFYSGYLVDEEGNEVPFEVTNEAEFKALEGVIKETLVIRMHKEKFDNLNSQKNPHKYDEEYKKHILTFYDNGIRHELYIEDINLVNAFKSDKLTRAQANIKRATSYVTKFMTSRNISFIPANLVRDIQTTMFLNKYFDDTKKDAAFKTQIIKNMGKVGTSVLKGVWKNDWNTDKEIGQIYNEWLLGGGRTGWLQSFKDVADIEKKIKKNIANTNKAKKWITNRYHFKTTEALAEFSENLVRFSVYYTAIQNGFTKEQSIWFSNDASLNFNLKGAKGNWLRAIYGFWNASLAGFYKVGKFSWENKGKAAITFGIFMAAGFGKWWLDQLDDEEEKRSEYKKQRMFDLFGIGIPMSYDLLPPYRIGYMLADVLFGDMTDTKFGYETAMSFTEIMPEQVQTALTFIAKYNPKRDKIEWANLEDLAGLTPTSLKPLAEIFITNKNFMGQEIQPENRFKDVPHSAKYKEEQVTALDKLVANFLNGIQGLDWKDYNEESKFTSGGGKRIVDVSPAVIHHLVSSYFSGTAQLITGLSDAITMATDEKEDGFNKISGKIPVINRFYIPTNESLPIYKKLEQMQAKYSDLLENHKEIKSVLNDKKSTKEEKAAYRKRLKVLEKNPLYNEAIRYKRREDDIRDLRKQLRLANKLWKYEQANELKMKLDKIDREINNK